MDEYLNYNRDAWNKQVQNNNKWTLPVSVETINAAREGNWNVVLTPSIDVPHDWFGDISGKNILCLASGGGQQAPIFAAAGANVTLFDLSEEQLVRDKEVAERDNLEIKIVQGNMTDLSCFEDGHFDLIFNPASNCFIPDVIPLWQECYRVLKKGGRLLSGFANPVLYLFEDQEDVRKIKLEVAYAIPYSDIKDSSEERKEWMKEKGYPLEFGHTLDDQIGGQLKAGFIISGFFEDKIDIPGHPIDEVISTFIATRAEKL